MEYEPLMKPPLVEAVCEFRFYPSDEWDWTVPGRLYDRIKEDFPRRQQVRNTEFLVQVGADSPAVQSESGRVMMIREDESALVQVGPHQLVVNHKRPYPGWDKFSSLVRDLLEVYVELVPSSPERTGLRYINQIPGLADGPTEIGSLTTLDPPLPKEIERPLLNFYQRYELQHDDPPGVLIHQTGMQLTPENDLVLLLDIDFGSLPDSAPNLAESGRWLQAAHDRIEEAFQASVNPDLLLSMRRGD